MQSHPAASNRFRSRPVVSSARPDEAMRDTYEQLAKRAADAFRASGQKRYWLGLSGGPGSGKTTVAARVAQILREQHGVEAIIVPMDGYHHPRSVLDAMPDPELAYRFRGKPFTFNASRFVGDIMAATAPGAEVHATYFPGFDHAVGDPTENEHVVPAGWSGVVLVEGIYVLLSEEPWAQAKKAFDETWFVNVDTEEARQRLGRRHAEAWGMDMKSALARAEDNDIPTLERVAADISRADLVVQSK